MREIKYSDDDNVLKVGEAFKYISPSNRQYILLALYSAHGSCAGCAFEDISDHPLNGVNCMYNGLNCFDRIFKPVDNLLENL